MFSPRDSPYERVHIRTICTAAVNKIPFSILEHPALFVKSNTGIPAGGPLLTKTWKKL